MLYLNLQQPRLLSSLHLDIITKGTGLVVFDCTNKQHDSLFSNQTDSKDGKRCVHDQWNDETTVGQNKHEQCHQMVWHD